jgi:hypothetical protein
VPWCYLLQHAPLVYMQYRSRTLACS